MYNKNKIIIIILLYCAKTKGTSHDQSPWLCVTYFAHSKPRAQSTAPIGGQELLGGFVCRGHSNHHWLLVTLTRDKSWWQRNVKSEVKSFPYNFCQYQSQDWNDVAMQWLALFFDNQVELLEYISILSSSIASNKVTIPTSTHPCGTS